MDDSDDDFDQLPPPDNELDKVKLASYMYNIYLKAGIIGVTGNLASDSFLVTTTLGPDF